MATLGEQKWRFSKFVITMPSHECQCFKLPASRLYIKQIVKTNNIPTKTSNSSPSVTSGSLHPHKQLLMRKTFPRHDVIEVRYPKPIFVVNPIQMWPFCWVELRSYQICRCFKTFILSDVIHQLNNVYQNPYLYMVYFVSLYKWNVSCFLLILALAQQNVCNGKTFYWNMNEFLYFNFCAMKTWRKITSWFSAFHLDTQPDIADKSLWLLIIPTLLIYMSGS